MEILRDGKMFEVFSTPIWKKAKDLTYNDNFGMIINTQNNIPEFLINNINVKLDKLEYWFMIGYFLGNGWIKQNRGQETIRFSINISNEIEVIYKINSIIPIISKNVGNKSKTYISKNNTWAQIFKMFLNETNQKQIPEWVQSIPNEYIKEFLNGFSKTDNCSVKNSYMEITTISINLAYGIQRLYLKLGVILNINIFINQKPSNTDLKVLIQKNIYIIRVENIIRFYNAFIENNYAWFAPLNINKKEVHNIPVYNIQINNKDNYFVENTLVQN
jgi:intein/homing endonuclease